MKYLKRLVFPILLLLGVIVFFTKLSDFENLLILIRQGSSIGILISFSLSLLVICLQAKLIQILYSSFKIRESVRYCVFLILGMNFANTILPSIGFSGVTLFVTEAKAKNIKISTALSVSILYFFYYFTSFSIILFFSLIALFYTTGITLYQIIAVLLFIIVLIIIGSFLYNVSHSKQRSLKIMTILVAFANTPYKWLKQKSIIKKSHLVDLAHGMYQKLVYFREIRGSLTTPVLYGLSIHLINILMLGYLFLAFNQSVSIIAVVVGFSMAVLFSLISITPSGVGFVEGAMILSFKSFNIDYEVAIIITLVYRGMQFWLPFLLGIYTARKIHLSSSLNKK